MAFTIPVTVLYYLLGILVGISVTWASINIKRSRQKIHGLIFVDDNNGLCKFVITSKELTNLNTKDALFIVKHGADLSREEQTL